MFLGTHYQRLDDKGRLLLPAKFRDKLAAGLVVTRGQDHCVYMYDMEEFLRLHEAVAKAPAGSADTRDYTRAFFSAADDIIPDKQGRITMPQLLRKYASLDRDVAVVGVGNRIEIWDTPTWEQVSAGTEAKFADQQSEVIPGIF
ncbi:division/cell wall cluster transcriptional repressor MraZ [Spelaeicoccus albus]|uniref:Transcriptional regulator MraZ n=1 Tax=Spelaeicoccus albus TaxID=1280376 RepID=A0A7Z0D4Z3_9MICO|nr:division/cell wall cluster transcriptional repressor MraZ [Spelaeicoccus albus]NYI68999.1 MraZ protein [Spelaeicoccus albus]